MGSIGAPELIIILIVVLLLFGSTRLPKLARSLGEASKEFKKGMNDGDADDKKAAKSDPDEAVTMTRAELDAMLAEREQQARKDAPPPTA
ncbi:MAG TPA: twin-arginine translocase TatA/TatE family subunit [Acidimicrobiia bacterium]|nr:twin-arginine translocase TatA/TatE family subunit [Acidimicrobiia bacterium]